MKTLVDFSAERPGGKAIKAAGYDGVLRYLSNSAWKNLTKEELKDYKDNGLDVGVVWETTADRTLSGKSGGIIDAKEAQKQVEALGMAGIPIYFAVDFDSTPAQQTPIDEYLKGCASIIGASRVGVYGSFYVVERCFKNKTASWFWQTLAWSGGQVSSHNHIYQNGKTPKIKNTDENVASDIFGGLMSSEAPIPTPIPTPTPAPTPDPVIGKSEVEPELRDALKYAHNIEIGKFIDPQDQIEMAKHLILLKDSEMSARKKVEKVRAVVI